METNTHEAVTASADENDTRQYVIQSDDKAHYAPDDDINWDIWWGEYIDGE